MLHSHVQIDICSRHGGSHKKNERTSANVVNLHNCPLYNKSPLLARIFRPCADNNAFWTLVRESNVPGNTATTTQGARHNNGGNDHIRNDALNPLRLLEYCSDRSRTR
ncbi:d6.3 [Tranosema rostrale ichnovirus]|nr:d6.3 [Tranosema rostrale ichnovirus]